MTNTRINIPQFGFPKVWIFVVIGIILALILSRSIFYTIDAGKGGVIFKPFSGGLDTKTIYGEGFHLVAPWNKMYVYDVRINEEFEKMDVLSKNGLNIEVELSYRFAANASEIGALHKEIGPEYVSRIVKPEIRSATREVIGQYLPEELYSTKREAIQDEIFLKTKAAVSTKHVIIDAVLIRSVQLPAKLKNAIEMKLEEEQLAFQYEFKLDRERKEAERRIIEAKAKADANQILNASLTDKILKDKGIEATLDLAKSANAKVVIIGEAGKGGLPLILGGN
ncbi:MAG TPA: prohibitin family protein [Saprospiraceae bacterium]|nr:prohibitin family protein [Saprospiraceae bacterium]